jgi:putative ABC transport system ATP-binding protein
MHVEPMILVKGLRKVAKMGGIETVILRGIDLRVGRGEFLAIMGPSGSGKSTLLGLMAGLDTPTAGSIRLNGRDLVGMTEDQLARLRAQQVGIIFQSFHLIPTLTALENVSLPLELSGKGHRARERAKEMLHRVGLGHRLQHSPRQLSGGEQQRVAIARALAPEPVVVFADEPTGNLDSQNGKAVIELMLQCCSEQGTTLVMVTHDAGLGALADRVVHMQDGVLIREEVHRLDWFARETPAGLA